MMGPPYSTYGGERGKPTADKAVSTGETEEGNIEDVSGGPTLDVMVGVVVFHIYHLT